MSLRFLTAGESHGKALVGILEGMPAGLSLSASDIQAELARRKLGRGRGNRQKIETDEIEILSGARHGKTLGSPIALLIRNLDFRNWQDVMATEETAGGPEVKRRVVVPRPGHADYVGGVKYGFDDLRNVLERASARETAMRVALASVARKFLKACGVSVESRVLSIGSAEIEEEMSKAVDQAKAAGDTLGGVFEVRAQGLPVGLGSYAQWDRRIEGPISAAVMSLNAIKGVEIGLGFDGARKPGSEVHDELELRRGRVAYRSNRSGGIDGGMTTGQPLIVRAAMKPLATLMKPLASVDVSKKVAAKAHIERSDVCAVPAAAVISESLVCLVLADALLEKFGGDSMAEILPRLKGWRSRA